MLCTGLPTVSGSERRNKYHALAAPTRMPVARSPAFQLENEPAPTPQLHVHPHGGGSGHEKEYPNDRPERTDWRAEMTARLIQGMRERLGSSDAFARL